MLNYNLDQNKGKEKRIKRHKKTSQHYYFDPFKLHIEIQLIWIKLRGMPLEIVVNAQNDEYK